MELSQHEVGQMERIARLEIQQEHNTEQVKTLTAVAKSMTHFAERMARVEEKQVSQGRIIWSAIGFVGTVQGGIILYLLQRIADGLSP